LVVCTVDANMVSPPSRAEQSRAEQSRAEQSRAAGVDDSK